MKHRALHLFVISVIFLRLLAGFALAAPANSAHAAVLYCADSDTVIFEQNADEKMLIASLTKIMTALVVLERCSPEEGVVISPQCAAVEGSSAYLEPWEETTVGELLYGLLMASGNDAAEALASHCAGSVAEFAELMNEKALEMGLKSSSFRNPHGLDAEGHYSTARELAIITSEALTHPIFAEIVATKTYTSGKHSYMNHNKLLWSCEGCRGVKTGYTMAAGRTLVSCAKRGGMTLICVTLSDADDWADHAALYDWGFENYEYRDLLPMNSVASVPVISGAVESVAVEASERKAFFIKKDAQISYRLQLPEFVFAAVSAGDYAGEISVFADGELLGRFPLVYGEDVPLVTGLDLTARQRIQSVWYMTNKYGLVLG